MRAVIQRVSMARVRIAGQSVAEIGKGLLVLVGMEDADTDVDAAWLAAKIAALRIFDDDNGVMNLSVNEIHGKVLVVSQFTLHAKTRKGTRPSYVHAAKPKVAIPLYEEFLKRLEQAIEAGVETGRFGANMQVELTNDGPVTIWIDTKHKQ